MFIFGNSFVKITIFKSMCHNLAIEKYRLCNYAYYIILTDYI